MAWTTLATHFRWGVESPAIYFDLYYDKYRSVNSMFYKTKISIDPLTAPSSFPEQIDVAFFLDNTLKLNTTVIKDFSPSTWGSPIVYESAWFEVPNKLSGTTNLTYDLFSQSRFYRYIYYLPVDGAGSTFGTVNNFTFDSSYGVGRAFSVSCTKYNGSYYDVLTIKIDGSTVATRNNYASGNVTFTNGELTTAYTGVYARMASAVSKTFTFELRTYTDSSKTTQIGNTATTTATGTRTNYASIITSVPNFSIDSETGVGVSFPVNVSKPSATNYDVLTIKIGSNTIGTRDNYLSGNVTFSAAELDDIYQIITTSNSTTFTFTTSTYTNSSKTTLVGTSTKTAIGTLTLYSPVLDASYVNHEDANATTLALTGDSSKFFLGYSDLQITVSAKATAQNYATLGNDAYVFEVPGETTQYANQSDSLNFVKSFTTIGDNTYNLKVIDSRANQLTISKTLEGITYNAPAFSSISITRQNGVEADILIAFAGTYTDWAGLSTTNSIQTAQYRYKEIGGAFGSWNPITLTTNAGGNFSKTSYNPVDLDITKSYDFEVQVIDKLGNNTQTLTVSSATPTLALDIGNKIVGFGKIPNDTYTDGSVDIAGNAYVAGTIYQNGTPVLIESPSILKYTENIFTFTSTETVTGTRANMTFDAQTDASNTKVYLSSNQVVIDDSVKLIFFTFSYVAANPISVYAKYNKYVLGETFEYSEGLVTGSILGSGSDTNLYITGAVEGASTTITNASTYFKVGVMY